MELSGKVALVTGAAKRVGREIALTLAERGVELVVHYHRSEREAQELLAEAGRLGRKAVAARADLSRSEEIDRLVAAAVAAFGRIDILINNAAIFYRTPFATLTEEDWDRFQAVNLKAPFLLCRRVADIMGRQGHGKILNLADIGAVKVWADYLPYAVSKAGLIALTTGLAKALAPNVQVNAIAPGVVLLPEGTPADAAEETRRRIPLKHLGSPAEVARAVVFLLESDFVTGEVLRIDGGQALV